MREWSAGARMNMVWRRIADMGRAVRPHAQRTLKSSSMFDISTQVRPTRRSDGDAVDGSWGGYRWEEIRWALRGGDLESCVWVNAARHTLQARSIPKFAKHLLFTPVTLRSSGRGQQA